MPGVVGSRPYPWPFDGRLTIERTAVVACGTQSLWSGLSVDVDVVLERMSAVAAAARRVGVPVVWIRHGRRNAGSSSRRYGPASPPVVGSVDWELCAPARGGDWVVDAAGHDATFGSPLVHDLRVAGRDQLVLCGLAADVCVDSTLRSLNDEGFECLVLEDACAPLDRVTGAGTLHSVTMSGGIFGALGSSAAVVDALGSLCDHGNDRS